MPNRFMHLNSGTSPENQIAQINRNFAQLDRESVTKQYKSTTGESLTFGKLPGNKLGFMLNDTSDYSVVYMVIEDGTPVLKIAKPGYDAATATDDQLIFNSSRNIFQIVKEGSFSVGALDAAGGANDTNTVVHDTGIASTSPLAYNAYIANDSGGYNQLPQFSFNYSGSFQLVRTTAVELISGNVNIRVFSQNFTGNPIAPKTVKYYLFSGTAN